jgi:prepilin-type N-terminal cleavage/methylation domain-containing protein
MKYPSKHSRAFTLIELLVVIGIVSVLFTVTLSAMQSAKDKALLSAFMQNLDQMKKAIGSYRAINGSVPHCTDFHPCSSIPELMQPLVDAGYISQILREGPWLMSYVFYFPGIYTPDGTISERRCGATLNEANWVPGNEPGIISFIHEAGREYGLPHEYTSCFLIGGSKMCMPISGDWLSCSQLY